MAPRSARSVEGAAGGRRDGGGGEVQVKAELLRVLVRLSARAPPEVRGRLTSALESWVTWERRDRSHSRDQSRNQSALQSGQEGAGQGGEGEQAASPLPLLGAAAAASLPPLALAQVVVDCSRLGLQPSCAWLAACLLQLQEATAAAAAAAAAAPAQGAAQGPLPAALQVELAAAAVLLSSRPGGPPRSQRQQTGKQQAKQQQAREGERQAATECQALVEALVMSAVDQLPYVEVEAVCSLASACAAAPSGHLSASSQDCVKELDRRLRAAAGRAATSPQAGSSASSGPPRASSQSNGAATTADTPAATSQARSTAPSGAPVGSFPTAPLSPVLDLEKLSTVCATLRKVKVSPKAGIWRSVQDIVAIAGTAALLAASDPRARAAVSPAPVLLVCKSLVQCKVPLERDTMDALCTVATPSLLAAVAAAASAGRARPAPPSPQQQQQQQQQEAAVSPPQPMKGLKQPNAPSPSAVSAASSGPAASPRPTLPPAQAGNAPQQAATGWSESAAQGPRSRSSTDPQTGLLLDPAQLVTLAWVAASSKGPAPRQDFLRLLTPALLAAIRAMTPRSRPAAPPSPASPVTPPPASAPSSAPSPTAAARGVGTALWALGRLDASLTQPQALVLLKMVEVQLTDMGPQELSDVAFGIARLSDPPGPRTRPEAGWKPGDRWLHSLCACLLVVAPHLGPQQLAHLVWALAKLDHQPEPPLLQALLRRCRVRLADFTSDSLSLLLYGLAGMGCRPPRPWIRAYLMRSMQLLRLPSPKAQGPSAAGSEPGPGGRAAEGPGVVYGAKSLARTAWSLAALAGGAVSRGGSSRPLVPTPWLNRFVQRIRSQLQECDAEALTQLALGLSVLGPTLSPGWMAAFARALQRQRMSLDLQVQTNMMWAWRQLRGRMEVDHRGRRASARSRGGSGSRAGSFRLKKMQLRLVAGPRARRLKRGAARVPWPRPGAPSSAATTATPGDSPSDGDQAE